MPYTTVDVELSRAVPMDRWHDFMPLEISVAAIHSVGDDTETTVWMGQSEMGIYPHHMFPAEIVRMIDYIEDDIEHGHNIITWNGLAFDFCVLAGAVSTMPKQSERVARIAWSKNHVDICFALLCSLGYAVSLRAAAEGMQVPGKMDGMHGSMAPIMWSRNNPAEQQAVIDYVKGDAIAVANVYEAMNRYGYLQWVTRRQKLMMWNLRFGRVVKIPNVIESITVPMPDTSWMDAPHNRNDSVQWLREWNLDGLPPINENGEVSDDRAPF